MHLLQRRESACVGMTARAVEPPPRRCSCSVSVREPARHRATAVWVLGLPGKAGPVMGAASQLAHAAPCPASRAGSPHPLYQKFIDRFGGAEYEALALEVRPGDVWLIGDMVIGDLCVCDTSSLCGGLRVAHSCAACMEDVGLLT